MTDTGTRSLTDCCPAVGARIAAGVRAEDLACRYGGRPNSSRFSRTSTTQRWPAHVAEKIRKHIGESYSIDGVEIHVTASIGLALYPADGQNYDVLLNRADAAMYRDKADRLSQRSS